MTRHNNQVIPDSAAYRDIQEVDFPVTRVSADLVDTQVFLVQMHNSQATQGSVDCLGILGSVEVEYQVIQDFVGFRGTADSAVYPATLGTAGQERQRTRLVTSRISL